MTTGSALYEAIWALTGPEREALILAASDSVPPWLLQWVPITRASSAKTEGGKPRHLLTYYVARDGWTVGTAADYRRTPLSFRSAKALALKRGWTFSTRRMVQQIHAVADRRVYMPTFGPPREATETYQRAHDAIESQLTSSSAPHSRLQSGGKKDLVLSALLSVPTASGRPGKQIWGGAQTASSSPEWWQGLSKPPAHDEDYVDYSEQWRPVLQTVTLDGQADRLHRVLLDPELAELVSDEGPIDADALLGWGSSAGLPPGGGSGAGGLLVRAQTASSSPAAARAARGIIAAGALGALGVAAYHAPEIVHWLHWFQRLWRR